MLSLSALVYNQRGAPVLPDGLGCYDLFLGACVHPTCHPLLPDGLGLLNYESLQHSDPHVLPSPTCIPECVRKRARARSRPCGQTGESLEDDSFPTEGVLQGPYLTREGRGVLVLPYF